MSTFTVYNTEGTVVGSIERPVIFQQPVDQKLIHRYLVWVRSVLRDTIAHTKTRGDVSGGGRKPWKQKGTGRARQGSTRSPHWRHGGVAFGPLSEQNWHTRMPRTERRKALFSALSSKADQMVILNEWTLEQPKTKAVVAMLGALPTIETTHKVLHVHADFDAVLFKATANLPKVTSKTVQAMSIEDVLNHDVLLITQSGMEALANHFTPAL